MSYITPTGIVNGKNKSYSVPLAIGQINSLVVDGTTFGGVTTITGNSFTLDTAPTTNIFVDYSTATEANTTVITLAEYKLAKGITDSYNDAQLTEIIPMVDDLIQQYCHRQFGIGTFTQKRDGTTDYSGRFYFQVENSPIIQLLSAQVLFYGTQETLSLDVTRFDIYNEEGYMYYSYAFMPLQGIIREEYRDRYYSILTYIGGKTVPQAVKMAAVTAVWDIFQYLNTTRMASGQIVGEMQSFHIGDYAESYKAKTLWTDMHDKSTGILLSKTVRDLLDPYVRQNQSN